MGKINENKFPSTIQYACICEYYMYNIKCLIHSFSVSLDLPTASSRRVSHREPRLHYKPFERGIENCRSTSRRRKPRRNTARPRRVRPRGHYNSAHPQLRPWVPSPPSQFSPVPNRVPHICPHNATTHPHPSARYNSSGCLLSNAVL